MSTATCAGANQQSPVSSRLHNMQKEAARVRGRIENLEERLSRVLMPGPAMAKGLTAPNGATPPISPLEVELSDITSSLEKSADALETILDRLAL